MNKNMLLGLGLLGALGIGAYFFFTAQNNNTGGFGNGSGGGAESPSGPAPSYNFTLPPPNFPSFEDSGDLSYDDFINGAINTAKASTPSYVERSSGMTKKEIASQRQTGYQERNPAYSTPNTPVKKNQASPVVYVPPTQSLHGLINPETGFRYGGR